MTIYHRSGPDRWQKRSKFFPGLATAMAAQWGQHAEKEIAS